MASASVFPLGETARRRGSQMSWATTLLTCVPRSTFTKSKVVPLPHTVLSVLRKV